MERGYFIHINSPKLPPYMPRFHLLAAVDGHHAIDGSIISQDNENTARGSLQTDCDSIDGTALRCRRSYCIILSVCMYTGIAIASPTRAGI